MISLLLLMFYSHCDVFVVVMGQLQFHFPWVHSNCCNALSFVILISTHQSNEDSQIVSFNPRSRNNCEMQSTVMVVDDCYLDDSQFACRAWSMLPLLLMTARSDSNLDKHGQSRIFSRRTQQIKRSRGESKCGTEKCIQNGKDESETKIRNTTAKANRPVRCY